jgi:hypothetical protein
MNSLSLVTINASFAVIIKCPKFKNSGHLFLKFKIAKVNVYPKPFRILVKNATIILLAYFTKIVCTVCALPGVYLKMSQGLSTF